MAEDALEDFRVKVDEAPKVSISDDGSRTKFPWSYRCESAPRETPLAYERFKTYLELGPGRILSRISDIYSAPLSSVYQQSIVNNWKERAAAWDESQAIIKAEAERNARHQAHLEKLEQFRGRSENLGTALITSSAQLLQAANKSIADIKERGDVLDTKLISGALNAAAKCAEAGRLLVAQSIGVDALIAGIDDADGDKDPYT